MNILAHRYTALYSDSAAIRFLHAVHSIPQNSYIRRVRLAHRYTALYSDSAAIGALSCGGITPALSMRSNRDRDEKALAELIIDLRDYTTHASSPVLDKYLKLAELMQKQLKSGVQ